MEVAVGRCVAAWVGSSKGMMVVGSDDGASVGASTGLLDGATVEVAVGRCVGAWVGSSKGMMVVGSNTGVGDDGE